jgi:aminoglycoside phosphotransferase (APT) family kinase protein
MNMAVTASKLDDFELLRGNGPVAAELEALLAMVASDRLLREGGRDAAGPVAIRRDVRVAPDWTGRWAVERFYWCARWRNQRGVFRARTLIYSRSRGRPRVYDFPDDPALPAAGAPGGPLQARDADVLRYIPARRITFRRGDALVGKFKHRTTLARSYAVLRSVHAVAHREGLVVPEPIGIDIERGVFYQQRMAGRSVQELIEPSNAAELMRAFGALHGAIHALPVEQLGDVRARRVADVVADVRSDAAWVAFALPDEAGAVEEVERAIVSELEALGPGVPAFCHGDPAIDQALRDGVGDAFAVVDFDDARIGDPHEDVASLVAALPLDAPELFNGGGDASCGERAVAAYLEGYRERTGRAPDERRLRAYRLRAALAALANRLHKGRAGVAEGAAAVARLRASVREG